MFYEPSKGHGLPNNPRNALVVPRDIDEFEHVGLTKSKAVVVNTPRVAESPAHLECRTTQVLELPSDDPDDRNVMVLGEVVAVHIDDAFLIDGRVDLMSTEPVGRLGYLDYVVVNYAFALEKHRWQEKERPG